jgi:hypothetical protein
VRYRHRWENNIKMVLKETGYEDVYWNHMAQDRVQWWTLVKLVMNLQVP